MEKMFLHCNFFQWWQQLIRQLTWQYIECVLNALLGGQQWSIVESSIEPSWTPCSCCHSGLVHISPRLSHGSTGWPYLCIITADAVRLVWTSCSRHSRGYVRVSPHLHYGNNEGPYPCLFARYLMISDDDVDDDDDDDDDDSKDDNNNNSSSSNNNNGFALVSLLITYCYIS